MLPPPPRHHRRGQQDSRAPRRRRRDGAGARDTYLHTPAPPPSKHRRRKPHLCTYLQANNEDPGFPVPPAAAAAGGGRETGKDENLPRRLTGSGGQGKKIKGALQQHVLNEVAYKAIALIAMDAGKAKHRERMMEAKEKLMLKARELQLIFGVRQRIG